MVSAADPNELAEQNLDAGDLALEDGKTIPLPADPTADHIDGGTPVSFDSNGYIEPMEGGDYSAGDYIVGIVLDQASESDTIRLTDEQGEDNYYSVHLDRLPIAIDLGESASRGDVVTADGSGGYTVDNTSSEEDNLLVVGTADDSADRYIAVK
jgi:hypothetical protein